jgi:hypothetical protein
MGRCILFLFAGLAVLLFATQGHSPGCPALDSEIKRFRLYLLEKQPDGLQKAALANCGSFGTYTATPEDVGSSLEDLVKRSSTILVGEATEGKTLLVDDGRYIVTEFTFHVTRVLKGVHADSDHTKVEIPGGTYKFEDGTQATDNCYCRKPVIGHTYVVFSNPLRSSSRILVPSFADQGIFELASDGLKVIPYSTQFFDFLHRPSDIPHLTQTRFLGDVQALIANENAKKSP